MTLPALQQFRADGCLSYLVADPASRSALLIDPRLELARDYRELLFGRGLRLELIVETQAHDDHFSAAGTLSAELGAPVARGAAATAANTARRLADGERFAIGGLRLETLALPGHTPDSIGLLLEGAANEGPWLFSGDTLQVGATARTDYAHADPEALYRSLHERLARLDDATVVLPAHDGRELLFTTLGAERRANVEWRLPRDEFVALKRAAAFPNPSDEARAIAEFNASSGSGAPPRLPPTHAEGLPAGPLGAAQLARLDGAGIGSISVGKWGPKLARPGAGVLCLDVREPDEYAAGHAPGTRNLPLGSLALHARELLAAARVYVACQSGRRSLQAARTLAWIGARDVVNVSGGFQAWRQAGLPVAEGSA